MKMLLWPFFGSTLCAFATWRTVLVGPSLFRTQLRFGLNKSKISYPEPDCQTMTSYHCLIGKTVVKVDTNLRLEPKVINRTIWLIIERAILLFPLIGIVQTEPYFRHHIKPDLFPSRVVTEPQKVRPLDCCVNSSHNQNMFTAPPWPNSWCWPSNWFISMIGSWPMS